MLDRDEQHREVVDHLKRLTSEVQHLRDQLSLARPTVHGERAPEPEPEDPILRGLIDEMASEGHCITASSYVDRVTAARLVGKATSTLANWSCMGTHLQPVQRGTGQYRIADIADFLASR